MLARLSIKNFALIDDLNVNFDSGFTTITGETGAGKSILLGALSLVLGKRADLSTLKYNTKKCSIGPFVYWIENDDEDITIPEIPIIPFVEKPLGTDIASLIL